MGKKSKSAKDKDKKQQNKLKQAAKGSEAKKNKRKKQKKSRQQEAQFSTEQINEMIATAAYYIAEKRGFDPDYVEQDWLEAKAYIESQLDS